MSNLFDPLLQKAFKKDKFWLEKTKIPMVTVFGTNREDIKGWHGMDENQNIKDIVLSRAHFSMAFGVAVEAWGKRIDKNKAWIVDPTNYVSSEKWGQIVLTESIGKTIARHSILKSLKDLVDKFGRQKLPILNSITPPLLFLTENINKPILSFHIAAGNILLDSGKTVLQVITDPHVRYDYLVHAQNPKLSYCVFDQSTKDDLLEKASIMGKVINPDKIIITGPPIDPRIISIRKKKQPWIGGRLKLCIATGGLGTNKQEIISILEQILPVLRKEKPIFEILVYCGTHLDIKQAVEKLTKEFRVKLGTLDQKKSKIRLIYHPQIVDANEMLIKYGFAWADGFVSKPSGDMAYDIVASGSFLLTLHEWGEWEETIRQRFEELEISRKAQTDNLLEQLEALMSSQNHTSSFVNRAMQNAQKLPKNYLIGAKNILAAYKSLQKKYL